MKIEGEMVKEREACTVGDECSRTDTTQRWQVSIRKKKKNRKK